LVNLPPGVVGHGSHSPNPNHGILISARNPGTTDAVTFDEPRLVSVYDANLVEGIGSPRDYLKGELKPDEPSEKITVIGKSEMRFRGWPAMCVHFRRTNKRSISEIEELVVYSTPKRISPLFTIVELRTTPEHYREDRALYLQAREGLEFIPAPEGACSND
jgi:hypothetical protein